MIRVFYNDRNTAQSIEHHCLRKRKYPDETTAVQVAKRMVKRYKKRYAVYCCHFCHSWHVGTDRTKGFRYLARKGLYGAQPKKTKK